MLEASLTRRIEMAYALMQRLDLGEPLSKVLPLFKTLAGLEDDETTQYASDLLLYGVADMPTTQPSVKRAAREEALKLVMNLCQAVNVGDITVDSVRSQAWADRISERNRVISSSVFTMERVAKAPPLLPTSNREDVNETFRIDVYYEEVQGTLSRLRAYAYDYASKSWQRNLKEIERIQLLGPDYRLVLGSMDALDSDVANELIAALENLSSENPANWALSALGCRNVILRLGPLLWQAGGEEYESALLKRTLKLTGDAEKNKLSAYIDAMWRIASMEDKELLEEAHGLVEPIYEIGSKGKIGGRYRRAEAQNIVVNTFRLVDILQQTTELRPYDGQSLEVD